MKSHPLKLIILLVISMILGCQPKTHEDSMEKWKQEIVDTEHAFAAMAKSDGIPAAFLAFAADSAVLMRSKSLVIGKKEIAKFYQSRWESDREISLSWEPEFVDVSRSGDLGYTYGPFVFSITDSTGVTRENTGFFHTVWKRQEDGSWRYVWD